MTSEEGQYKGEVVRARLERDLQEALEALARVRLAFAEAQAVLERLGANPKKFGDT